MGYVTSLFAYKMVAAAGDAVDQAELLASAGLEPHAEPDPRVMMVDTAYYDLLEKMAARIDVTALPLGAAKRLSPD
ncbi:MAG: AraC family transcriptional regulator, partial [Pseudomonadota bacterium]